MFAQRLEFTFLKSCRAIVHQQNNSVPRGPANCSSELALDCEKTRLASVSSSREFTLSCFVQVLGSALIRCGSQEYSLTRSLLCLILNSRTFVVSYSKHLRRILLPSAPPPALVSLHLSHICSPPPATLSIVNTPTHTRPTHMRIYMHAYTRASVVAKGRPNARFDAMALWSLSSFPLPLCSSIIHSQHIVCVCLCVQVLLCGVTNKTLLVVRASGQIWLWEMLRDSVGSRLRSLINMLWAVYMPPVLCI